MDTKELDGTLHIVLRTLDENTEFIPMLVMTEPGIGTIAAITAALSERKYIYKHNFLTENDEVFDGLDADTVVVYDMVYGSVLEDFTKAMTNAGRHSNVIVIVNSNTTSVADIPASVMSRYIAAKITRPMPV